MLPEDENNELMAVGPGTFWSLMAFRSGAIKRWNEFAESADVLSVMLQ
jgi:hypothetical protein